MPLCVWPPRQLAASPAQAQLYGVARAATGMLSLVAAHVTGGSPDLGPHFNQLPPSSGPQWHHHPPETLLKAHLRPPEGVPIVDVEGLVGALRGGGAVDGSLCQQVSITHLQAAARALLSKACSHRCCCSLKADMRAAALEPTPQSQGPQVEEKQCMQQIASNACSQVMS